MAHLYDRNGNPALYRDSDVVQLYGPSGSEWSMFTLYDAILG